jgi:hypothetical protein
MSFNAEENAQAQAQAATKAAAAAIPPLNPAWPYQPIPINLWDFGLNNDIAAQYLRPASSGAATGG